MIEVAQRKSLRIILNKDWFCSRRELYNIDLLPVSTLSDVNLCLNVFKISSNMLKNNVEIQLVNQVNRHQLRSRNNFVTPFCHTQLGGQNFYVRALSKFNALPPMIKNTFTLSLFKRRTKEYFYEIYCDANELN